MKNMKKFVCLLLAALTVFALCACGSSGEKSALQEIKDSGVLTVALSPDFSPMEFVDSSKTGQEQYVGFDVMLAQFIAEELGVKLEIQAMSFDACQTAVSTASVPLSISGFSWTEERAENFELSDYYYAGENETEQVLLIRKADGVLTVTLSPDFSPMEFVDSSKSGQEQYVGFDVSLAKYIAEYLGVELVIEPMGFDACQSAVYTGSVPVSISGYSWTEERAENYEMSDYYYAGENETEQVLLIRKDDAEKYTKAEDFKGLDVGAQNASLQMQLVTDQLAESNAIPIGDITVGVMELKSGNIEALAVAKGNAEMIIDANPELVICDWQFEVKEEYEANVIIVTKGETELLAAINEALAKAKAEGLYAKWYDEAVELGKSENAKELTLD